jgi:hypothetical protein
MRYLHVAGVDTGTDTAAALGGPVDDNVAMTDRLLELARVGDHDAFEQLVDPLFHELQVHCYRLLGSFDDAEDVLKDSHVAAWRGLPDFRGGSSIRTWLYRIPPTAASTNAATARVAPSPHRCRRSSRPRRPGRPTCRGSSPIRTLDWAGRARWTRRSTQTPCAPCSSPSSRRSSACRPGRPPS